MKEKENRREKARKAAPWHNSKRPRKSICGVGEWGWGGWAEARRRCQHEPARAQDIPQNKGHERQAGRLPGTKTKTDSPRHIPLAAPRTQGTRRSYKPPGRKRRSDSKDQGSEWLQTSRQEYWTPGDDGRKPTDSEGK